MTKHIAIVTVAAAQIAASGTSLLSIVYVGHPAAPYTLRRRRGV